MKSLLSLPDGLEKRHEFGFFDDFEWFVTAHRWTSLASDSGASVAHSDAPGGKVVITTGGTDNNEATVYTTTEPFLMAAAKSFLAEARLQYSEANTDDANVCFGFANAIGANLLVDDGAGPKSSFSGALIYKLDGGTVWRCRCSVGTGYIDSISNTTAGGSAAQVLRIEITAVDSTVAEVTYFVDGVQLRDSTSLQPIKHRLTYTSATDMNLGVYAKAGGANSEVVTVDYIGCSATR